MPDNVTAATSDQIRNKPRQTWFRFRLRTMLVVMGVSAVSFGWFIGPWYQQQAAFNSFEQDEFSTVEFHDPASPLYQQYRDGKFERELKRWLRIKPDLDTVRYVITRRDHSLNRMACFPALEVIQVDEFSGRSLQPLKNCPHLIRIALQPPNSKAQLKSLGGLERATKLESLSVRGFPIESLEPLRNASRLSSLWIDEALVTDLSPLSRATGLRSLSLKDSPVPSLKPIAKCKDLRRLNISATQIADLSPLRDIGQLQFLDCSNLSLSDISPLKHLPYLELINLSSCGLDSAFLQILSQTDASGAPVLPGLRHLNLADNPLDDLNPLQSLTQLNILNVSGTNISDLSPLNAARLKSLDLSHTHIRDLTQASEHLLSIGRVRLTVGGPRFDSFDGLQTLDRRFLDLTLVDAANVDYAALYKFEDNNQEPMIRVVTELSRLSLQRCNLDGFKGDALPMGLRALSILGCNSPLLQFSRRQYRLAQIELADNNLKQVSGIETLSQLRLLIYSRKQTNSNLLRKLKKASEGKFELRIVE